MHNALPSPRYEPHEKIGYYCSSSGGEQSVAREGQPCSLQGILLFRRFDLSSHAMNHCTGLTGTAYGWLLLLGVFLHRKVYILCLKRSIRPPFFGNRKKTKFKKPNIWKAFPHGARQNRCLFKIHTALSRSASVRGELFGNTESAF